MKQSKTTLKELTARYRAVLLKCALLNLAAFAVAMPAKATTISSGTYTDELKYNEDLGITGGTFEDAEIDVNGHDLSVNGGTFTGYTEIDANDVTISGGTFNLSQIELEADTLKIDSDKASFTRSNGIKPFVFTANTSANILGNTGLNVVKTAVSSPLISGKIIANDQSFIGNFGGSIDKWTFGGNTLYSVWVNESFGNDATFDKANITLNGNAAAGTGIYMWDITGAGDPVTGVSLKHVQNKLTPTEIDNSVELIMKEIKRIDEGSKSFDDLSTAFTDALEVPYTGPLTYYQNPELFEYIMEQWAQGNTPDENVVRETLLAAYNKYNENFDKATAQVNIKNSTITMNGTAGLVNGTANNGNIVVSDGSIVTANGTNEITAKSGTVSFKDSTLVVANGANFTVATKDGNTLNLTNSTVDLSGTLNGNLNGGSLAFNSANARLNGTISGTAVNINTNLSLSALPSSGLTTLNIADGKTLDIGSGTLKADSITGGTISAILTDAAKDTAIITASASASNVTLKLDMSNASRDAVTEYKITDGTGFTFGDYASNRYAVSASNFDIADAKTLKKLSGWNGGNLWILRLATASEAAIEDLEAAGVKLPENEKNASKILDLANDVLDKLTDTARKNIEKVNDLLDNAAGNTEQVKQILSEVAPDTAQSGAKTATNTAKSVINVVETRFGSGVKSNRSFGWRGRSGGDYAAGRSSVWAQGMMNYAKLDKQDGFNAHSSGFAAGVEVNFTDSFKAGVGYAYTSGDISTERAKTDVDTHTGFMYGEYKPHRAYVNGVVSYGHSKYDEKTRTVQLTSDYDADTIAAQIAAGYDFGLLTPEAALRFTNVRLKEYTDAMGATLRDKRQNTWTGVAGVKASKGYHLISNPKINFTPELKMAATYDFARDDENRTVVLPDHSSYVASGDPMERFGVEAGAGLTVAFGNSAEINLSYDGKFKKDYQDHTGMVNLKVTF